MRIRPTRIRRNTAPNHGCDECCCSLGTCLVYRRGRRRRRRLSLLVKIEGDPLNTQHAQARRRRRWWWWYVLVKSRGIRSTRNTREEEEEAQEAK